MKHILIFVSLLCIALIFSCKKNSTGPDNQPEIIKATGNIQDAVNNFRAALGPLNTVPNAVGGRREINWDEVPDSLNDTPLSDNFFNQTDNDAVASQQRGVVYSTTGSFMVSSDGFASINSGAASQFTPFSGTKTFANTSAEKWDVKFQKAGTTESAYVQAFGAVFADVDEDSSTSLEFFDDEKSLGKYFVPAHDATSNFSFLAVQFKNDEHVTKVTVSHDGFLAEGIADISEGGTRDQIVLDDFIYSEPEAL